MEMTKEYILECLEKYCILEELSEETFYEQVVAPLRSAGCFEKWGDAWGVTKGVLIFTDLDFVVKIPFGGHWHGDEEHWEGTHGTWHYRESRNNFSATPKNWRFFEETCGFEEFCGADEEDGWNYCLVEKEISDRARETSIGQCFAATTFLGYAGEYPIYIQERCTIFCDEESSRYEETYKHRTKSDYESLKSIRERVDFWGIDDNWILDFLIYWGEEMLRDLANFIFENDIEDLHNGNIGYRKGVPVLVDYSSYRD